jgi:glycerol-3-phosphate dehydrogenase
VDLVAERIEDASKRKIRSAFTKSIPLGSEKLMTNDDVEDMIREFSDKVEKLGLDKYYGWYLVTNYGAEAEAILNMIEAPFGEIQLAEAELRYGIKYEMITRAEDFLVRRTGRLYFDIGSLKSIRGSVIKILSKELHWDDERVAMENKIIDDLIYDATHYYKMDLP